jgi:hypothetical protein
MVPCLCIVFALAALAAPVADFERLERRMQDLIEQERFDELARDGEAAFRRTDLEPWQRRELAFYAIRGYHKAFAVTGKAATLCRARGLLRRVEREVGFGDSAAVAARLRSTTEDGLRRQGPKDPCGAKVRGASNVPTPTPGELLPVRPSRPATSAPPPGHDDALDLIDVTAKRPRPATRPRATMLSVTPEAPSAPPSPPAPDPEQQERRRDRVIAGSVLLASAAGLGVGMGAALWQRSEASMEMYLLLERQRNENSRPLTEPEFKRYEHLVRVYRNLTSVAGITGATASVALIAGAVLLAVKQRARATATVSATPTSAMLTLTGRF